MDVEKYEVSRIFNFVVSWSVLENEHKIIISDSLFHFKNKLKGGHGIL
jgi:hypothetical protein